MELKGNRTAVKAIFTASGLAGARFAGSALHEALSGLERNAVCEVMMKELPKETGELVSLFRPCPQVNLAVVAFYLNVALFFVAIPLFGLMKLARPKDKEI